MRPVDKPGARRILDQQAAQAEAVDEEIGVDARAARKHDRGDSAVGRTSQHLFDLAFQPHHAAALGILAQQPRIQRGVEMEGVAQPRQQRIALLRPHEAPGHRRQGIERIRRQRCGTAGAVHALPQAVERHRAEVDAIGAERMEVALSRLQPVDEFDAQLEAALGRAQERVFVDAEQGVEQCDRRNRRFAHTDRADRLGLDQGDARGACAEHAHQGRRGHPARAAAADDGDVAQRLAGIHVRGHRRRRAAERDGMCVAPSPRIARSVPAHADMGRTQPASTAEAGAQRINT